MLLERRSASHASYLDRTPVSVVHLQLHPRTSQELAENAGVVHAGQEDLHIVPLHPPGVRAAPCAMDRLVKETVAAEDVLTRVPQLIQRERTLGHGVSASDADHERVQLLPLRF